MSARRSRTVLLVSTVALAALLIAAVTSALSSVQKAVEYRVMITVGAADLRIAHVGQRPFDAAVVESVRAWPEAKLVVGRGQDAMPLKNPRTDRHASPIGYGIDVAREYQLRPQHLVEGKLVEKDGEIVLDTIAAADLGAKVGDVLDVERFGEPIHLTVVGVVKSAPLGGLARPESFVTLEQLGKVNEYRGKVREIDVVVKEGVNAQELASVRTPDLEKGLVLRVTARVTSTLEQHLKSNRFGMAVAAALAFIGGAFIIATGLTTAVTERQRELAVLRCIGGTRLQLGLSQILIGGTVGVLGAFVGVPIGTIGAWVLVNQFPDQLPGGFSLSWVGLMLSFTSPILSGLVGGMWPAIRASRTSPLEALAARSKRARGRGIVLCGVFGVIAVLLHVVMFLTVRDLGVLVWMDPLLGVPLMFGGYFLLSVPVTVIVAWAISPLLGVVLRLPRGLLYRTVRATPYRHGFTGGAMMIGLAIMIAIWTNGRAVLTDWLDSMKFPDAFVFGTSLSEESAATIAKIPGVTSTCAITLQPMNPKGIFSAPGLGSYNTTFIAFEPDRFFAMAELQFVEGDRATALRRLNEGGAVMVAREYTVAKGVHAGDRITLTYEGKPHEFEVVAVVNSPGLDIVNQFFDIGESYLETSISAVFGSRRDLKEKFGNDAVSLIQFSLDPTHPDPESIVAQARKTRGVISAGSAAGIKSEIRLFLKGTLYILSLVAVSSMLVACFGVANLIVAGIQTRQFEFGVLRAIGAHSGQVARLVLGEAVIVAIVACVLGTVMGSHAAWAGQRVNELLIGLSLHRFGPPLGAAVAGWGAVFVITLGAAAPAVMALGRRRPRELLGAMRG